MALQPQKIPVNIRGLDTKTDSRQQDVGEMTILENVRFDNYPQIRKRFGYERRGVTPSGIGKVIATFQGETLVGDGHRLLALSDQEGFLDRGMYETVGLSSLSIAKSEYQNLDPDFVLNPSGLALYTWTSGPTLNRFASYQIVDTTNGDLVLATGTFATGSGRPKPFALSDRFVIVYEGPAASDLWAVTISYLHPTVVSAPVKVASSRAALSAPFVGVVVNDVVYCAFRNGTNYLAIARIAPNLTAATTPLINTGIFNCLGIFTDGTDLWFAWHEEAGTATYYAVYTAGAPPSLIRGRTVLEADPSLGAAHFQINNFAAIWNGAAMQIITDVHTWVTSATENRWYVRTAAATVAGTVTGVATWIFGLSLASNPILYGGRTYVMAKYLGAIDPTYFLLSDELSPLAAVAKVAPGSSSTTSVTRNRLPTLAWRVLGEKLMGVHLQVERVVSLGGTLFSQDGVQACTFDWTVPLNSLEASQNLLLAGGIVSMYDGEAVCELGFHYYPEAVTTVLGAAGATIPAGDYYVCATYEWVDAQGIIHESAPSPVSKVTVPVGGVADMTHTVPTLKLTSKASPIAINIYRTSQAIRNVMFLVTGPLYPVYNDRSVWTVSYVDSFTEAKIVGNSTLIANPLNSAAEVASLPPFATNFLARYRNRIVFVPAESPGQWMYSKALETGVPVEFNPLIFFQPTDLDGDPLTGLAGLDDKLIMFKGTELYFTSGDGPSANGSGSDYGTAQHIPTDSGCTEPRSIILGPTGLFYKSAKGLMLLQRNLAVTYIGADVEGYNASEITSASLVATARRVIFTLNSGLALAYDYQVGMWSVWRNIAAVDSVVQAGRFTYLRSGGDAIAETPNAWSDPDSQPIAIGAQFGWFNFAGQNGAQRLWRFIIKGDYRGAHKLAVSIGYNDSPALQQNELIDCEGVIGLNSAPSGSGLAGWETPGGGEYPQYEWQVKLAQQRSTNIQLTVREIPGFPINEGLSLSSFAFLAGVQAGLHKVPASRTPNTLDAGTLKGSN